LLDARVTLLAGGAAFGLLLGSGLWAVGSKERASSIADTNARLDAVPTATRRPLERSSDALAAALARPLFADDQSQVLQPEAPLRLAGLVRTPTRAAALLAIGGAPLHWISVGEEQQGVQVQTVSSASVVVSTANGEREIFLASDSSSPDEAPPGMRGPRPPASAPNMR
jgi:hypothetical protein